MKKRLSRFVIAFSFSIFLLMGTASIAPAQHAGPFYAGVFGAFVTPDDLEVDNGPNISLDDSWAIGAKGGYIFPQARFLAVEFEYTYLADQDFDEPGYAGDFSAHNFMGNFIFRYPEGKIHPFVGAGLGLSNGKIERSDLNIDDDDTAVASQFLAGVNFELAPNLSADLMYKYFYCEYEFDGDDAEAGNHMFQVGLNYHF